MRVTLVIVTLLTMTALRAEVVCEKKRGRWYPKNEKAIKIADYLGVKTCSGYRFKDVVKELGETSNVTASKKNGTVKGAKAFFGIK